MKKNKHIIVGGILITIISLILLFKVKNAYQAVETPYYVSDPALCPQEDVQFEGQKCPANLKICGVNDDDIPQCYDTSVMSYPSGTSTSNTLYSASLAGGYVLNCFAQPLDSAAPYCDNNGAWFCNRDSTCYSAKYRDTVCQADGGAECGSCRSGYQDCGSDDICEVRTGVTNYPTGANNNYGASCTAQCDSGYLDCDAGGAGSTNGCEVQDNAACGTNAIIDGCDGSVGNCVCQTNYYDCDSSGPDSGNGCEIEDGASCTDNGVAGTWDGPSCTCVGDKLYFETGTDTTYGTHDPLLWGTQMGTGYLISFNNSLAEQFVVLNDGTIKTASGLVINMNNEEVDAILAFGNVLGVETLKFDNSEHWFEFSDDVNIEGDLYVTGLINGVDITNLSAAEATHLKTTTGGGLTVNIAYGNYRLYGTTEYYDGQSGVLVQDDTTNYVYFDENGLQVNQSGFPLSHHIPVSEVVTSGGAVTLIRDRRVMQDDGGQSGVQGQITMQPLYPYASYSPDGQNNTGQLRLSFDSTYKKNYYQWVSTPDTMQDYTINVPVTLPLDFSEWDDHSLKLTFKSDTADPADNKIEIFVFDTDGDPVTLSGSTANLASANWDTTEVEFTSSNTWTPGEEMLIQLKVYSKSNSAVQVSELMLLHQMSQ